MSSKKRQPFFFFMLEIQKKKADKGIRLSMREMPEIASPLWANMSKAEKRPYEEKARYSNAEASGSGGRKTCHGVDYSLVEQEQRQAATKEKKMKEAVSSMISKACVKGMLGCMKFYVIHVNYFCESRANGKVKYSAAELAILEFSLQDGVGRGMHMLINLDTLPYGFTFEAKRHSSETHDLPLPPQTVGSIKIHEAVSEVIKFIDYDNDNSGIIFTFDDHVSVVSNIFEEVLSQHSTDLLGYLRFYSLSELLFHLKKATYNFATNQEQSQTFASVFLAESYLERGTFDYAEGMACEYHEENDRVVHCSQTKVRGWAYSIIHSCAPDLNIDFVEGKHEPQNTMAAGKSTFSDTASVFSYPDTDVTSEINVFNPSCMSSKSSVASTASTIVHTDDFLVLRDYKRGKGRGNLL
ncbi:protein maelstrom homolog [Phlebotomus argentipes]|uniref:protein maelstrom homolog n=1 Tax=Phlebotomus argentipes TaxID=94469 RepID=UPI002892B811|nr:protein maelstrom homolog [Phlebotomus argentipes]